MNRARRHYLINNFLQALVLPVIVVILWQLLAFRHQSVLFPGPLSIAYAIQNNIGAILGQLTFTLSRVLIALVIAVVSMIPLGIALGRIRLLGLIFEPLIDMLATLPPPAIIPLVTLFAGTGGAAKITMIWFAAAVPLLLNTYEASKLRNATANLAARSFRLSPFEIMLRVDFPASLPMIATGLRMSVASALLVAVTAEILLSTNGIGVFLEQQLQDFQIAAGLAGIVFIAVIGLLANIFIFWCEKHLLYWHYKPQEDQQ